ncbi:MAG: sigma-54 dependent transcriptional regulator [Anditalea sp.]
MKKILIIDDELSVCNMLTKFLSKNGYNADSTISAKQGLQILKDEHYDLILCDYRLKDTDGLEFFKEIKKVRSDVIVIFITGYVNLKIAVDLIKDGAYHYLAKPLNPDELLGMIEKALSNPEKVKVSSKKTDKNKSGDNEEYVIGKSEPSKELLKLVHIVGPTDYTVIIEGETGTGKESVARLIHEESKRKNGPFIAIDCGSLSKEIAASELFGHEKGAFTGAVIDKTGVFELAESGTVFLDEVSNLSLDIQVSLLRALQEKVVRKVGSLKQIKINVRIIAATNENLYHNVNNGLFREDLYHRLNEFTLKVPALKDRVKDLPLFVDFFLDKTAEELQKDPPIISPEAWQYLQAYHWPGNIRELRNVIRRACLLTISGKEIGKNSLPENLVSICDDKRLETKSYSGQELGDGQGLDLKSMAQHAEAKHIIEVLNNVNFNKTKAAKLLNIDRKTLYQKLKLFNID